MATRIETPRGTVETLESGESKEIPSDNLSGLERPGRYEVKNIDDIATIIFEHASEKRVFGIPIAIKPDILIEDGEARSLRVSEDPTTEIQVINYYSQSPE